MTAPQDDSTGKKDVERKSVGSPWGSVNLVPIGILLDGMKTKHLFLSPTVRALGGKPPERGCIDKGKKEQVGSQGMGLFRFRKSDVI